MAAAHSRSEATWSMLAVERYLRPFLIGKPADRIDDLWQAMYNSSYWRNGPVLNNAISGVDQALWDIKGRRPDAGVPVAGRQAPRSRRLLRARSRCEIAQVSTAREQFMARGFRHVRVQVGVPGMEGYGSRGPAMWRCFTPGRSLSRRRTSQSTGV